MRIDWTKYYETFPDRYFKLSALNSHLNKIVLDNILSSSTPLCSLDIGGNIEGTAFLKHTTAYFLDPYVEKPEWYREKLTWDNVQFFNFDLIIANNSLNYLTKEQIELIPKILKPNGIFIANTFFKPTEINREFINSKSGIKGIERSEFRDGKIYHYLEFDDKVIEHSFYYYSIQNYIDMFEGQRPIFQIIGDNSMIIKISKI